MRFKNLSLLINHCRIRIRPLVTTFGYKHFRISDQCKCVYNCAKFVSTSAPFSSRIPQENDSDDDLDIEYTGIKIDEGYARDLLYKNSKNLLLNRIYCCSSVQEVLNVFNSNHNYYKPQHITQTIFVLYDLHRIYEEVAAANMKNVKQSSKEFVQRLQENKIFQRLLKLVESKIHNFDSNTLSYSLLYLTKLGLGLETPTIVVMCETLKKSLMTNFSISPASRFLETVFSEYSVRSYFMSEELIPLVINQIDLCTTADSLHDVSLSLNKLHNVVTDGTLDKYKRKVENLIENGSLSSRDCKTVLQIISFLNYPKWREKNSVLVSKCLLLIKNNLTQLNINEIILVYEIFFRIQEPGDILNELQRCSSRYFHQLDDTPTTQKISLFSTLIYFASPKSRIEFHKTVKKYVEECSDYDNLILLRKLLSYVKISDMKLCQLYWNKVLGFVKKESGAIDLIKLSQNYINFSADIDSYRHLEFETELLKLFDNVTKEPSYHFFPQKLASVLNFVLMYSENTSLLEYLVAKIENNWGQLRHIDCLKMSYTLKVFNQMGQKYFKHQYARRIDKVLDRLIQKEVMNMDNDLWKNNALLKSCVYKNKVDGDLMNILLNNFENFDSICSKNIENVYYCFFMTNTSIPKVIDNMTDYIVTYKNLILGFNVGRVIYLCYCLGYHPKKLDEFCETVINIIIRDQERMTGLLIIYSALALCFFNKLPKSLIKSIFNVEFMEKLDKELENCYARDKYPQRVRNHLMQLNRAVCLEYPESNVPWFHQKYIDEMIGSRKNKSSVFANKIREYLRRVVNSTDALEEDVVTPYGYEVDFVLRLDHDDEIVVDETQCTTKVALLLITEFAYTRGVNSQLKGHVQLKRRHLEILGYRVIFVKFSDWIGLFYAEERLDFLRRLIWPKKFSSANKDVVR